MKINRLTFIAVCLAAACASVALGSVGHAASALLCLVILILLGTEGALALAIGGQAIFFVLREVLARDLPILALGQGFAVCAIVLARLFGSSHRIVRGARSALVVIPFLLLIYLTAPYMGPEVKQRFISLSFSAASLAFLAGSTLGIPLSGRRLAFAASAIAIPCYAYLLQISYPWFGRIADVPVLDIARIGCLAAILALLALREPYQKASFLWLGIVPLGLLLSFITETRQGLAGVALAALAVAYVSGKLKSTKAKLAASTLIIFAIEYQLLSPSSEDASRISSFSLDSRSEGYALAWLMFFKNPFLGEGLGSFGKALFAPEQYPHNMILEILAEFGIVGLLLFGFWLLAQTTSFSIKAIDASQRNFWVALAAYWFSVSLASYSFPHSVMTVALISAAAAAIRRTKLVEETIR